MGSLGGLLGTAGGAAGTGFKAPGTTNIAPGTSASQISGAQAGLNNSLQSQQALLQALQSQQGLSAQSSILGQQQGLANQQAANNGIGNQASAYTQAQQLANEQAMVGGVGAQNQALQQQQGLNQQLGGVGGVQNQQSALQAQQALASEYQGIVNGSGPNPAMAALNQQTGANVANQAALMAGQRGASQNVGLIARQAAQQGAATQQQAVGQGATMQAQQSLNALSGVGQAQSNVAGIAEQQIGQQQTGVNAAQAAASNITAQQQAQQQALAGQAATQIGQQQAQQQAVAGQANMLAGQQMQQTQNTTQAQLANAQLQQQALAAQNQANVSMQSNVNAANSGLAQTQMAGTQGIIGGVGNSVGAALSSLAEGGEIKKPKKYAMGEYVDPNTAPGFDNDVDVNSPQPPPIPQVAASSVPAGGPQSGFGKFLKAAFKPQNQQGQNGQQSQGPFNLAGNNPGAKALQQGFGSFGPALAAMFKSTTPASPDNAYTGSDINPQTQPSNAPMSSTDSGIQDAMVAKGGMMKKRDFTSGGNVKAANEKEKAVKAGNSYDNDKIPAVLSEGEVVIPRSVMQSADPIRGSADFVAKVMAKRKK